MDQLTKEYTETREKLDDVLRELGRQKQLATDVEKEVSDRIEQAKTHAAEFVADMAFQFPIGAGMVTMPQSNIPAAAFIEGEHLPMEEPELNHDWTELKLVFLKRMRRLWEHICMQPMYIMFPCC